MAIKQSTMRQELTKALLTKLYLQENMSTYSIAKKTGWSPQAVFIKCRKHGIKLRKSRREKLKIDKSFLQKLYVEEGKSVDEELQELKKSFPKVYWHLRGKEI